MTEVRAEVQVGVAKASLEPLDCKWEKGCFVYGVTLVNAPPDRGLTSAMLHCVGTMKTKRQAVFSILLRIPSHFDRILWCDAVAVGLLASW